MNEILSDAIHIVLVAGGTLSLEHIGKSAFASFKAKALRRVWSFLKEDTHLFVPLIRPLHEGAATGYGDLLAASMVIATRNKYFSEAATLITHTNVNDYDAVQAQNLVVLGGGRHNPIYRNLIEKLSAPLHFFDTPTQSFVDIRNADRSIAYTPTYDADSHVVRTDVGLLIHAKNPRAPDKTVVIAAGSHSFGTAAAIQYMSSTQGIADLQKFANDNCEVVVQCNVVNSSISNIVRVSQIITW